MISGDIASLVCDMDGVIYRGDQPIAGAPQAIMRLRSSGVRVLFCTNNSSQTVEEYRVKLGAMGIEATPDDILTSAVVTADVLKERGLKGKRTFIVGGAGMEAVARDAVLERTSSGKDAEVVLVGWDPSFDYSKMRHAADAVRAGAVFIASNSDATFPSPEGALPGAGAILASIEVASGRRAEVLGKPHKPMTDAIARRLGRGPRVAAVGDRPDTDLAAGRAMGWMTILVLTGVTSREQSEALDPQPDLIAGSLADLG